MIKNILFDFDGTLADTAPGIVYTLSATLQQMNVREMPSEEAMRQTIGIPLCKSLQKLGNFTDEEAAKATAIYSGLFMTHELQKTALYPEVCKTLSLLKEQGIHMAIVTSRNLESLEVILDRYAIRNYFEQIITNNDHLTPKPAPDMVLALLERMSIKKEETMVVGDTTFDIEMGNNAGCLTCAVTYGNHSREKLQGVSPDYIIDTFADLVR